MKTPNILVKMFKHKEHADLFCKGKLHACTLGYFKALESQGQGDPNEGAIYFDENSILTIWPADNPKDYTTITNYDWVVPPTLDTINHVFVVCFHALDIPITTCEVQNAESDSTRKEIHVVKRLQQEFGPHMVVITKRDQFRIRLKKELKAHFLSGNFIRCKCDRVVYDDCKPTISQFYDEKPGGRRLLPAFYKHTKFAYQKEYRIVFERSFVTPVHISCTFDIGNLRDITFCTKTAEALVFQAEGTVR